MKNLKINKTPKTPEIDFNPISGVFLISGVSVPENSMQFYGSLINWVKEYVKTPAEKTNVMFKLVYVNTSSLQFIYDFLKLLDSIDENNFSVSIDWYYLEEDIDMKEMGEDFKDALSVNFSFYEVETVD